MLAACVAAAPAGALGGGDRDGRHQQPVNFIVHLPSGDSVPDTGEPGGDRSFIPANDAEVWIRQGDATVYPDQPATG